MRGRPTGVIALLRRWGPALAWYAGISLLSAQPGLRVSDDAGVDGPARRLAHLAVYGVLAILLLHGSGALRRGPGPRTAVLTVGAIALLGALDELHQSFVPARTGRPADVAIDVLGGIAGIALVAAVAALRGRRRPPGPDPSA